MRHRHKKKTRRRRWLIVLVAVPAAIVVTVLARPLEDERGQAPGSAPSISGASTTASTPPDATNTPDAHAIVLDPPPRVFSRPAKVPVRGEYPDAAPATDLLVQVRGAEGRWMDFPLPTVVGESGGFTTYVELGPRGTSKLRVFDPASGATSNVVTVEVR